MRPFSTRLCHSSAEGLRCVKNSTLHQCDQKSKKPFLRTAHLICLVKSIPRTQKPLKSAPLAKNSTLCNVLLWIVKQFDMLAKKNEGIGFLEHLESLIQDRKVNPEEGSYTSHLFNKGINKIAQKVGEEAVDDFTADVRSTRRLGQLGDRERLPLVEQVGRRTSSSCACRSLSR